MLRDPINYGSYSNSRRQHVSWNIPMGATVDEIHDLTCAAWAGHPIRNLLTILAGARGLEDFRERWQYEQSVDYIQNTKEIVKRAQRHINGTPLRRASK